MKKVKLVKNSYTLPNNNRVVPAGEYDTDFFTSEEIDYLKKLGSIIEGEVASEKAASAPKRVQKRDEKQPVASTGAVKEDKNQESKE